MKGEVDRITSIAPHQHDLWDLQSALEDFLFSSSIISVSLGHGFLFVFGLVLNFLYDFLSTPATTSTKRPLNSKMLFQHAALQS